MKPTMRKLPLLVLPVLAGLGIAGIATAETGMDGGLLSGSAPEPVRCEIAARDAGPMIALESRVYTDTALEGRYSFTVVSAGRAGTADISQGGSFTADPGEMIALGSVMIGNNAAGYTAKLEVTTPDHVFACESQVGGIA